MTDKQIIIDGVDVSGCGHYWNGTCHAYTDSTGKFLLCVNSPHCYYKQFKRKEQECEELKEDIERWKSNFNGKVSAIEELLQQLDQFKVKNIKISKTLTEIVRFFKEDEKFARYSGRPIIFAKPALEKIEKILKENDINQLM